jgi:hypothetical protein
MPDVTALYPTNEFRKKRKKNASGNNSGLQLFSSGLKFSSGESLCFNASPRPEMGYTTDFEGQFAVTPALAPEHARYLAR